MKINPPWKEKHDKIRGINASFGSVEVMNGFESLGNFSFLYFLSVRICLYRGLKNDNELVRRRTDKQDK